MKWLMTGIFFVLYAAVTLFGLGPVLIADGTITERFFTLLIVLILYFLITIALLFNKNKRK